MEFNQSETRLNLMRAFAGESQARNRYTFAAAQAKAQNLYVIEQVFRFTADQEKEHAEIFLGHLRPLAGETLHIDGGYPVDIADSLTELLRMAQHNEYEEHEPVYRAFGDIAAAEGFPQIAASFYGIGAIEKTHGDRFGAFAALLAQDRLFVAQAECGWMCLNCGHTLTATETPPRCPICNHDRGYFIRLTMAPFQG